MLFASFLKAAATAADCVADCVADSALPLSAPQAPYNTVTYSIIGDDEAPNYFSINPASGVISVVRALTDDSASSYRVSVTHRSLRIVCSVSCPL